MGLKKVVEKSNEMLRPYLRDDEYITGYVGRTAQWNWAELTKPTSDYRSKLLNDKRIKPLASNNLERIAVVADISYKDVIQKHTLLPFYWSVDGDRLSVSHADRNSPANPGGQLYKVPKWQALFCPSCVDDDLNEYGFSIWKTRDHLPGSVWCWSHNRSLLSPAIYCDLAMMRSPDIYRDRPHSGYREGLEDIKVSIVQRRVIEIENYLLSRTHPLKRSSLIEIIREKALMLRIQSRGSSTRESISDYVISRCDKAWIIRLYPEALERMADGPNLYLDWIFLYGLKAPPEAYALLLGALWENTDDAIYAIEGG